MTDIPEDAWSEAKAIARKAVWADGRGMIGRERNYLEDRIARAIMADSAAQAERMARLDEALKPFAKEAKRLGVGSQAERWNALGEAGHYIGEEAFLEAARALSQEGSDA